MGEEGIQRAPLTSDGSETETEPCDTALPKGLDDASASGGPPKWRFHSVKGRNLPGDDSGRKSFDTLSTFVVGDPGARFGTHTPLTYETTGAVAWWQSRLQLVGPRQEKTELPFFPASEQSGLHRSTQHGQAPLY